jgi:hypothetical protein
MVPVDDDRSAALVIRVWQEGGAQGFRARLSTTDTSPGSDASEQTLVVASSSRDVLAAVGAWLDGFRGTAPEDPAGQG